MKLLRRHAGRGDIRLPSPRRRDDRGVLHDGGKMLGLPHDYRTRDRGRLSLPWRPLRPVGISDDAAWDERVIFAFGLAHQTLDMRTGPLGCRRSGRVAPSWVASPVCSRCARLRPMAPLPSPHVLFALSAGEQRRLPGAGHMCKRRLRTMRRSMQPPSNTCAYVVPTQVAVAANALTDRRVTGSAA